MLLLRRIMPVMALVLGLPAAATAFTSVNRQTVNPLPNGGFEVVARPGAFSEDYWCAAGDFARRSLRIPWDTQLYVSRTLGPSDTTGRRSAVQFSTDPANVRQPADPDRPLPSLLRPGTSQSVTAAFGRCRDVRRLNVFSDDF
jgi:hypothetical protein